MFEVVAEFEFKISDFFGSRYAVATDSCTHAIELCLRYKDPDLVACPSHTYISIPFTLEKLHCNWHWYENKWQGHYNLTDEIIDGAAAWGEGRYVPGSMFCLSFQIKKCLKLGRGGAILLDKYDDYNTLKRMSYDGRDLSQPWQNQDINMLGYHYYMTPETAREGINQLEKKKDFNWQEPSWQDYPDLRTYSIFKEKCTR